MTDVRNVIIIGSGVRDMLQVFTRQSHVRPTNVCRIYVRRPTNANIDIENFPGYPQGMVVLK